jgi:hypothetical protein
MQQVLSFIQGNQIWIYLLLFLAGLAYLRATIKWLGESRRTLFNLERERAVGRVTRAAAMLALVITMALSVFIVTTFVTPAMGISETEIPPTTQEASEAMMTPTAGAEPSLTEVEELSPGMESSGCDNPFVTLTNPRHGDTVSGIVSVTGTASINDLAFYKFEYRSLTPDGVWRPISAGLKAVVDGELGTWDTTLVRSGLYAFRLVVTNTAGVAEEPCIIRVQVLNP